MGMEERTWKDGWVDRDGSEQNMHASYMKRIKMESQTLALQ